TYGPTLAPPTLAASAPVTASTAPSQASPAIALSEWKVDVASTIKAGSATFTIVNNGTIAHELLVFKSDLAPAAYPKDASGDIVEDGPGVTLLSDGDNIDPAGTQSRTIDLAPGTYLFVCNIPGHFKAGMFTVVTVTP
ncbi:MAG TPA: plastocyanin/azurin family copper-binding protein, partial [Candidatus Limnocylindrales bacterium]|nr:plastocyanin/azurin family copper-binding protein [Candidatus Limnocylindrales bacterium]